jgi:uncharacterized protein (TIRG00374 family)
LAKLGDWLKRHWKEAGGVLLGLILLFFLFETSDFGKVVEGFQRFRYSLLFIVFALVVGRELVRIVEWRILLRQLGIRARWRHTILGLLSGDASQIIPAGIYVSNAVLEREEEANVARSLSATAAMQYLEVVVCLLVLAVIGVAQWWWIRIASVVVLAGFLAFMFGITREGAIDWLEEHANQRKRLGKIVQGLKEFVQGMEGLLAWRALAPAFVLAALHLALTIGCLYAIMQGLGMQNVGWTQAAVVYSFVLAIVNLNPLPTDIGVSEGSGMSIFLANGVPPAEGLTAMLLVRFGVILSTAILLGLATAAMPHELKHLTQGANREDARANAEADPNSDVEPEHQQDADSHSELVVERHARQARV